METPVLKPLELILIEINYKATSEIEAVGCHALVLLCFLARGLPHHNLAAILNIITLCTTTRAEIL